MSTRNMTIQYILRKKTMMIFIAIIFSFFLYSYAIASTTISIADSRQLNKDILELQTQIAELEWEYQEKISTLDIEDAHAEGFDDISKLYFVSVDDSTEVAFLD